MALVGHTAKRLDASMPPLKDQGMPYLAAAAGAGVSISVASVTQVGASPFTVQLGSTPGLSIMENDGYLVVLQSAGGGLGVATLASKTASDFDITGGSNADVYEVAVIGRLKNQAA